jgi:hypothetical protein
MNNKVSLSKFFQKKNKSNYFIEFFLLPAIGVFNVCFIQTYLQSLFSLKFYENAHILINGWFFFHVYNTLILSLFYPYNLSALKMGFLVISWEIVENIIVPNFGVYIGNEFLSNNFKEPFNDITGDILAAVPAICILYCKNKYRVCKQPKIKHL